jgi:hypothetical protein
VARSLLALALVAGGLACITVVIRIAQGCDDDVVYLAALGVFGASFLFSAWTFLLARGRSTSRWKPWALALGTMLFGTSALSVVAGLTAVSNCAR